MGLIAGIAREGRGIKIRFQVANKRVRDEILMLLRRLGIRCGKFNSYNRYGIVIGRRMSEMYLKKIGFLHLMKFPSPEPNASHNGPDNGMPPRKGEQIPKPAPSSDRGLQLALVKAKSLVTVGEHTTVNTSLLLVHTARHANRFGWG